MVFTLAACGGNNTTPSEPPAANTPAPTPEQNTPAPTPENNSDNGNGNDSGDNNDGNNDVHLGGPLQAPEPFESHPGDAEHFRMLSDDFVLWGEKYTARDVSTDEIIELYVTWHVAFYNLSDGWDEGHTLGKWVFPSDDKAEETYNDPNRGRMVGEVWYLVGNIIYIDGASTKYAVSTKDALLAGIEQSKGDIIAVYISKP